MTTSDSNDPRPAAHGRRGAACLCSMAVAAAILAGCGGAQDAGNNTAANAPGEENREHETGHAAHWGYESDNGPASWGSMNADWALCASGEEQSPIDLGRSTEKALPAMRIDALSARQLTLVNQAGVVEELDNGHTIQVNVPVPNALTVGDKPYSLRQFHFHSPSEHTVDGKHYPMEIHFVNEADDGSLAVVGVFVEEGEANGAIDALWANLPDAPGTEVQATMPDGLVRSLVSGVEDGVFHYTGSLTTPPCSEGVSWFVKRTPARLSRSQIAKFQALYDHNNRPTQPLNGREVYRDDDPVAEVL
jgi:carbonic anhydrase